MCDNLLSHMSFNDLARFRDNLFTQVDETAAAAATSDTRVVGTLSAAGTTVATDTMDNRQPSLTVIRSTAGCAPPPLVMAPRAETGQTTTNTSSEGNQ